SCPLYRYAPHQDLPSFPTRRSSDLIDLKSHALTIPWNSSSSFSQIFFSDKAIPFYHPSQGFQVKDSKNFSEIRVPEHTEMPGGRSEEHTSELQSRENLVCRLLLEKK